MKKEKKTEIAVNVSSGAEKVENVESVQKEVQKTRKTDEKELGGNATKAKGKAEKETAAAKERVKIALKKKEAKAKKAAEKAKAKKAKAEAKAKRLKEKAEERKALQEKRKAERKALQEKRRAERLALAEKRKEEKNAKVRERAHQKANRAQAKSKRKSARKQEGRNGRKDNGGWIAAVVTLGATTLALTTALTVGAIDMKNTKDGIAAGYKCNTHELIGIMENVDNDLDRVRISNTPEQQGRILTDLLVQTRLAELDLEKMPVSAESDRNVTTFLNRVGQTCERMLAKLRSGETLSEEDQATLARLYEVNHQIRAEIETLTETMTDNDLMDYINKGKGMLADVLNRLEKMTLGENGILDNVKDKMTGAGMARNAKNAKNGANAQAPMQGENGERDEAKIDPSKAEDLCSIYFSDYKITEFQCVGETVARGSGAYNVQGYDDNGTLLFAEIDYKTGDLLRFDYYEDCNEETFDYQNAQRIAEEFLEKIGYDDMQAVRVRENGTNADFTFVYEEGDVLFYPDTVKVKVCRTRGIVMGMDATKYLKNHKDREEPSVRISAKQAQERLHKDLDVRTWRLCVVQTARGERVAYEFVCDYGEEQYYIYTDANDGREISIVNLKNIG